MNKTELIDAISDQTNLSKKDTGIILDTLFHTVSDTLAHGDNVMLIGFGTFDTAKRAARKGKNPQTGAIMDIPAATVPRFKPGKALKELVNS